MTEPTPQLHTVEEAMGILHLSKDKIYELMEGGHLAYIKLPPGTKQAGRRIEASAIAAFLDSNRTPAAQS